MIGVSTLVLNRRSRLEVVADILIEALNGANKTRLVYRANLNFLRFQRYFSDLLERELIVEENTSDGRVYRTTDKGRHFLRFISDAEEIISS